MSISKFNGAEVNDATLINGSAKAKINGTALAASSVTTFFNIWYDGDNVTESGGVISQLIDQGLDANNANQSAASNKPTYTASNATFNNQPTIDPDGGDVMILDSTFNIDLDGTWTAFFVGVKTGTYWSMWEGSSQNNFIGEQLTATATYFFDGTGAAVNVTSATYATANIWLYYCDGSNIYCYNGSDGSSNSVSAAPLADTAVIGAIFKRFGAAVYADGQMAMSAINYTTNLSDANKNTVGSFLASKYGLTWTSI